MASRRDGGSPCRMSSKTHARMEVEDCSEVAGETIVMCPREALPRSPDVPVTVRLQ